MFKISNLHVAVDGKEVLKGINLTIPDNEGHALFGPNGSGKSVLMSTIMGYPEYEVTNGEILYNGELINDMEIDERVRLGISALEQRPPTIKGVKLGSLADMILQNRKYDDFNLKELTKQFDMDKFLSRNINDGFSGGEIKKSEIFLLIIAHVLVDGKMKCSGSPRIMMNQIREKGYEYCIRCQQNGKEIS